MKERYLLEDGGDNNFSLITDYDGNDGERAEHREHVYRFGSRQRLPHPVGDVEQRTQPGDAFRHARHVPA